MTNNEKIIEFINDILIKGNLANGKMIRRIEDYELNNNQIYKYPIYGLFLNLKLVELLKLLPEDKKVSNDDLLQYLVNKESNISIFNFQNLKNIYIEQGVNKTLPTLIDHLMICLYNNKESNSIIEDLLYSIDNKQNIIRENDNNLLKVMSVCWFYGSDLANYSKEYLKNEIKTIVKDEKSITFLNTMIENMEQPGFNSYLYSILENKKNDFINEKNYEFISTINEDVTSIRSPKINFSKCKDFIEYITLNNVNIDDLKSYIEKQYYSTHKDVVEKTNSQLLLALNDFKNDSIEVLKDTHKDINVDSNYFSMN